MARRRSPAWTGVALAALAAVVLGLAACGGGDDSAGETSGGGAEITLTLAYVTTATHPYGQAIDFFAKEVEAASGGRIVITTRASYPQSESQLLTDVRNGSVDMATVSTAIWDAAGINTFQALQAPFLVNNYDLEARILTGPIGTAMRARASQVAGDIDVLAIHEGGLRKPLGATKPLDSVQAFRGAKIRAAQSKVQAAGLSALGAQADPLPLPEVYQALKNGTVDGMEANLGLIATNKYYEVAKYVTGNVNLWPFPTALVINAARMRALSATDQKILTDAAAKVPDKSIEIVSARSTLPQQLVDCGIRFVTASAADIATLQTAARKAYAVLGADPATRTYLAQIQKLKDATPAPAAPPPPPPTKSSPNATCALG